MTARYDTIGRRYARHRRPDSRWARTIHHAVFDAGAPVRSVVNVGAGAGSYEPSGVTVVAVEPSMEMISQRPPGAAPAVRAVAESLPFAGDAFDVALAILTVHHWTDLARGGAELRRVADRVVVLTFEAMETQGYWLLDYVPEIGPLDATAPTLTEVVRALGGIERIEVVPVPHDCEDGFLGAYWRRPERYLDASVRAGMSGFARLDQDAVERGIARLRADLDDGTWVQRYGDVLELDEIDLGYRLLVG